MRPSGEGARATEGLLLTWLQRHRLRRLLGASLWITPAACMVGAIAIAPLIRRLDEATRWSLFGFGPAGARALTAAFVSTTFTCIVFVFTILLVAVQIASAQLTPRIIARAFANNATRAAVGLFAFTFVYGLAVLSRIDASVPQLGIALTIVLNMATIATFVYLVSYLGEHLRPVSVLTDVGNRGIRVIEQVYPSRLTEETAPAEVLAAPPSQTAELASKAGAVLALDTTGLGALAERGAFAGSTPVWCETTRDGCAWCTARPAGRISSSSPSPRYASTAPTACRSPVASLPCSRTCWPLCRRPARARCGPS